MKGITTEKIESHVRLVSVNKVELIPLMKGITTFDGVFIDSIFSSCWINPANEGNYDLLLLRGGFLTPSFVELIPLMKGITTVNDERDRD